MIWAHTYPYTMNSKCLRPRSEVRFLYSSETMLRLRSGEDNKNNSALLKVPASTMPSVYLEEIVALEILLEDGET